MRAVKSTRGEYRSIYTTLPDDDAFIVTTPLAKAAWYTLKMTLPSIGIGSMNPRVLATRVNCTLPELEAAALELTPLWVRRSSNVFWIVNGLRFHPALSPDDSKHRTYVRRKIAELPDSPLVTEFRSYYAEWFGLPQGPSMPLARPFDGGSDTLRSTTNNKQQTSDVDRTTAVAVGARERVEAREARSDEPALSGITVATPADAAVILTSAANLGITARYGEQTRPLRHSSAGSLRAAEEIAAAGVPILFARDAIYALAAGLTLEQPPQSVRYFVAAVRDRWMLEQDRAAAERLPAPAELPESARTPTPIGSRRSASSRDASKAASTENGQAALLFGKIRGLIRESQQPGQAVRRFIPRAEVESLGPDVVAAYDAIGGADRILNATGDQIGFVLRDFVTALGAAHVAA